MPPALSQLDGVFSSFLRGAITVVGTISIIMLVIGGIKFLSAGSDKEGAARARNTLTYAILGLALALASWLILMVFGRFLGFTGLDRFTVMFN